MQDFDELPPPRALLVVDLASSTVLMGSLLLSWLHGSLHTPGAWLSAQCALLRLHAHSKAACAAQELLMHPLLAVLRASRMAACTTRVRCCLGAISMLLAPWMEGCIPRLHLLPVCCHLAFCHILHQQALQMPMLWGTRVMVTTLSGHCSGGYWRMCRQGGENPLDPCCPKRAAAVQHCISYKPNGIRSYSSAD